MFWFNKKVLKTLRILMYAISVGSVLVWCYFALSAVDYVFDAATSIRNDRHVFHDGLQQVPDMIIAFVVIYQLLIMAGALFSILLGVGVHKNEPFLLLPWLIYTALYLIYFYLAAQLKVAKGIISSEEYQPYAIEFIGGCMVYIVVLRYAAILTEIKRSSCVGCGRSLTKDENCNTTTTVTAV